MKIFVCYTTRDKEVTREVLEDLNEFLSTRGQVYIDLIHNDSLNKQNRVIEELDSADQIFLIKTKNIYSSEWVNFELKRASDQQKPIKKIDFQELKNIFSLYNSR